MLYGRRRSSSSLDSTAPKTLSCCYLRRCPAQEHQSFCACCLRAASSAAAISRPVVTGKAGSFASRLNPRAAAASLAPSLSSVASPAVIACMLVTKSRIWPNTYAFSAVVRVTAMRPSTSSPAISCAEATLRQDPDGQHGLQKLPQLILLHRRARTPSERLSKPRLVI
jgi:hypothetical protein